MSNIDKRVFFALAFAIGIYIGISPIGKNPRVLKVAKIISGRGF
jgi:hypothetical protein